MCSARSPPCTDTFLGLFWCFFPQLIKLFRLEDYPAFTKPVDPSLYLHRFVDRLKFGNKAQVGAEGTQGPRKPWPTT